MSVAGSKMIMPGPGIVMSDPHIVVSDLQMLTPYPKIMLITPDHDMIMSDPDIQAGSSIWNSQNLVLETVELYVIVWYADPHLKLPKVRAIT